MRKRAQERLEQVHSSNPVDHAVMNLCEKRETPIREAVDHVDLPQRAASREVLREQSTRKPLQLFARTRLGDTCIPNVKAWVEAGVIDPDRMPKDWNPFDDLAIPLVSRDRRSHEIGDPLEVELPVTDQIPALEDEQCTDVHRRIVRLDRQERCVQGRQTVTVGRRIEVRATRPIHWFTSRLNRLTWPSLVVSW